MKKKNIIILVILGAAGAICAWWFKSFIGGFIAGVCFTNIILIIFGERAVTKIEEKKFAANQALQKVIDSLEEIN